MKFIYFIILILFIPKAVGQQSTNALVLKEILKKYYKIEKPVYKNRSQLLYFYCDTPNNNEELVEAVKDKKLPTEFFKEIKSKIKSDTIAKNWSSELEEIYSIDKSLLKQKIYKCINLENYNQVSKILHLNNQRLMIVSKPLFYSSGNMVLVKVTFYRNIEHNNGVILLLEKVGADWIIKEELNVWST